MSHALLSPSSSDRWFKCPPSARAEEGFPDKGSAAADEGTLAHSIAEHLIPIKLGMTDKPYQNVINMLQKQPLYNDAMGDYMDSYASFVAEQYNAAKALVPDARIYLEQKLDMRRWVPDGEGTGDVIIATDQTAIFIDLKYGKGVPVYAENNKQLMLYALGVIDRLGAFYDIQFVKIIIYQPRIDNISEWTISTKELLRWAEIELKPAAQAAYKGEGSRAAGDHCRFCKAKGRCRAFSEYGLALAAMDFTPSTELSDEEVAQALVLSDRLKSYATSIEDYAFSEALKGKKWPGFKLVAGRSNRQYSNADDVAFALANSNISTDLYLKPKEIVGITALEKNIGKKFFSELVGPYIVKPKGKPTLVPATDKRAEWTKADSAADDFNHLETE